MTPAERRLAEAVRDACIAAVREAWQDASMRGLCDEGALEAALGAAQALDLERAVRADPDR